MSESVYRQWVADLAANDGPEMNGERAEQITEYVLHADSAGEPWAYEVLTRWQRKGAASDYSSVHKELNSIICVTRDGRRKKKTASYSRPRRSAESGEIVGYQMQTWWGMSRAQVAELERDLANQHDQIGESWEQAREVGSAMDRHPECDTAREAWLADGRSLNEIDLSIAS